MIEFALFRPARSRAATAIALSPALGSGTDTVWAKDGVAGRLRAIGSLPALAQAVSISASEVTAISRRPLRQFGLKFPLHSIIDVLSF